jgi:hypothetical protein
MSMKNSLSRKTLYFLLQTALGIAILLYISLYRLNLEEITAAIKHIQIPYFILAALAYFALNLLLSYRLFYLMRQIGYRLSYLKVLISHLGGMLVGDVTPGRSGYFLTPAFIKKITGARASDAMACIFAPQGVEFLLKVAGAILAMLYLLFKAEATYIPGIMLWTAVLLLLLAGGFMLAVAWLDEQYTQRILNRIPIVNRFTEQFLNFKTSSFKIRENIRMILLLYMASWFFSGLQWYFIGQAMNLPITYLEFFLLHPLITTLMFVPLTPAGLGIMESGGAIALSLLGITPTAGFAFALLVRVNILLSDLAGISAFVTPARQG